MRVGVEGWGVGWIGGDRRWSGGWEVDKVPHFSTTLE